MFGVDANIIPFIRIRSGVIFAFTPEIFLHNIILVLILPVKLSVGPLTFLTV